MAWPPAPLTTGRMLLAKSAHAANAAKRDMRVRASGRPRSHAAAWSADSAAAERDVAEPGLVEAPVPRPPQPHRSHALRERPLDPGPGRILSPPLVRRQLGLRRLQRALLPLRVEPERPAAPLRPDTEVPNRTGPTGREIELDDDILAPASVGVGPPRPSLFALGARRDLVAQVEAKAVGRVPAVGPCLPAHVPLGGREPVLVEGAEDSVGSGGLVDVAGRRVGVDDWPATRRAL